MKRAYVILFLFATAGRVGFGCGMALLRQAQARSAERAFIHAKHGDRIWVTDGHLGAETLNHAFESVLDERTVTEWLDDRKRAERPTHVVELYGSAVFAKTCDVDSLTGVRLLDTVWLGETRASYLARSQDPKRAVVTGDLAQGTTWRELRANLGRRAPLGADLVVVRPEAGYLVDKPLPYIALSVQLLERAYALLSPNEGTLLVRVEVRSVLSPKMIRDWFFALRALGVDLTWSIQPWGGDAVVTMRLVRHRQSPPRLPRVAEL